ncbi:MAG: ribonuclease III [Parcubacteria group bacterium 21-54-25]|nr:MAG: ribonuclease III [Parcubacteria group bacterium 21-54-25]HQU07490.1 ribonuclease III [Candidatus Paceibacterota bacterium]
MPDFTSYAKQLGLSFDHIDLFVEALTHRSYLNENRSVVHSHNERLEFLGDAVLELVVTHFLFMKFPEKPEGELTAYRAALVNTQSLASSAEALGVNDMLLLSKGEAKDTGRARQIILANAFEAIVGAVYLDRGYAAAAHFIAATIHPKIDAVVAGRLWQDAKSRFQEVAQEQHGVTPRYETLGEEGPDHDKHFTIGVFLKAEQIALGFGKSKQEAEQDAARVALQKTGW